MSAPPPAPGCPICHRRTSPESGYFPFCSSRCRSIDLDNWLGERYVVAGDSPDDEGAAPLAPRDDEEDP